MRTVLILVSLAAFALAACSDDGFTTFDKGVPQKDGDVPDPDSFVWNDSWSCKAGQDSDNDKIPDDVEGCKGQDEDADKYPNYSDTDADGDKVPDSVEAGPDPKKPVDSDGDKKPDFLDQDSDNDGVPDGKEDLNSDGKLGCCLIACNKPDATWQKKNCKLTKDGCGKGQKCSAGKCQPVADFLCSNGETSPQKKSTFNDGISDKDRPNFICYKSGEAGKGLKQMKFKKSTGGDWHLALEMASTYGEFKISGAAAKETGAVFDLTSSSIAVAGFVLSVPTKETNVLKLTTQLISNITTKLPGRKLVSQLSSGNLATSHDKFPTVLGVQLDVTMSGSTKVAKVRDALLPVLLGRVASSLSGLPTYSFGPSSTRYLVRLQTLLRKDGRYLIMGGVAESKMAGDVKKVTGIHLDDLSNGTGLAQAKDKDTVECDPFKLQSTSKADIIWVVDESGSMSDNRLDVANNANDFFSLALKSGLDFRMAVTNVVDPTDSKYKKAVGKFCSKQYAFSASGKLTNSQDAYDMGGTDRFLLPTEQKIFKSCVLNPPGYEGGSEYGLYNAYKAVTNHLPRKANDPSKIRPDANLVIIVATDELPNSIMAGIPNPFLIFELQNCILTKNTADWLTKTKYKMDKDLYTGKSKYGKAAEAVMHTIGGVCNNTCGADIAHGYIELSQALGGQVGDVCQKNLGKTLQAIISSISGQSSPAVLEYVPISASLAVALGKNVLTRSRVKGFDYSAKNNSIVFIGTKFAKGDQVVASYRRWVQQEIIK